MREPSMATLALLLAHLLCFSRTEAFLGLVGRTSQLETELIEAIRETGLRGRLGGSHVITDSRMSSDDVVTTKNPSPLVSVRPIVGSTISTEADARAFRQKWDCLTSLDTSAWARNPNPRQLGWPVMEPLPNCVSKEGYLGPGSNSEVKAGKYSAEDWPVAEALKYTWKPRIEGLCGPLPSSFLAMDGQAFCSAMRRRGGSMFVVGDSLSRHFRIALLAELRAAGIKVKQWGRTPACMSFTEGGPHQKRPPCSTYMACGESEAEGGVFIHWVHSLFLARAHQVSAKQTNLFANRYLPELSWGAEMVRYNASVVVMNRGAHYTPPHEMRPQLEYTITELRRLLPDILLFFRATAPGHPECGNYPTPLRTPLQNITWPFHWDGFSGNNRMSQEIVEAAGGVFLDIEPMALLRPDWHFGGGDCLHYCLPGPPNEWARMFVSMLDELTPGSTAPPSVTPTGTGSTVPANGRGPVAGVLGFQVSEKQLIVGSVLEPGRETEEFRARWQCLTSMKASGWVNDPTPRLLPWPKTVQFPECQERTGFLGAASNADVAAGYYSVDTWQVAESVKYVWRPKRQAVCGKPLSSFSALDGRGFCGAMRRRGGSMFIVGDSLSSNFKDAILLELEMRGVVVTKASRSAACIAFNKLSSVARVPGCQSYLVCGNSADAGGVHLHYVTSTLLRQVHSGTPPKQERLFGGHFPVELAFGPELVSQNASVVVLNRGAVVTETEAFSAQLSYTLVELRKMLPKALLIYRSTDSGHADCEKHAIPLMEPVRDSMAPYNRVLIQEQNAVAKALTERVGGAFLDIEPMTSLRADWHVGGDDCIHYCMPGPVNDWARVFTAMLKELV